MSRTMLINVILEEESRVAIVDNGVLDFYEIETRTKETLKGNIYKGVVENVNASLDAAFVDCGWERPGFLPLDEVNFRILPTLKTRKGASKIQEHVHPGMEVLVQVIRDRIGTKPPSVSTYYSLPGRYLVLTPHADSSGVSRRIEDEDRRSKLKKIVDELRPPEKYGFIVRTAGLDQDRKELARDMGYLLRLWETIEQAAAGARAPSLIYRERGLALRTIRDHLTDDVEEVLIDDEDVHASSLRFIRSVAPHQEPLIKLYTGDKPLFTRFNLEEQIETIYKRRVPLKSGGEIVIEGTEGMTAIDVNSSRSRESSVEELALRTNLEAATEIGRQLRLRDIGGLIVIDFIDMEKPKHLRSVEKAVVDSMRADKAKYDATKISKLGMMEISRQRLKAAKSTATYVTCPGCDGAGSVKTTEAAALSALRRIQTRVVRGDIGTLGVTLPSEVALYLLNQQRDELIALERRYDVRIALTPRPDYPKERCELETAPREGPAPAVTREAQKRRLEAAEAPRASAPRRPAVGEDGSLEESLGRAAAASADLPRPFNRPAEPPDTSWDILPEEPGAEAPESALETPAGPATTSPASGEPAGSPADAGLTEALDSSPDPGRAAAAGPVRTSPLPGRSFAVPSDASAHATDGWDDSPAEDGFAGDLAEPVDADEAGADGDESSSSGAETLAGGEGAARKKRRRRGGRGRKKHPHEGHEAAGAAPGSPHEEPVTAHQEAPGGLIWEDEPAPRAVEPPAHDPAAVAEATDADRDGGVAGAAKKRRRRRGGRGRGKGAAHENGSGEAVAVVHAPHDEAPDPHPEAHKKRRRRRGKKHEGPHGEAGPTAPALATAVASRPQGNARVPDASGPGQGPIGDEDVPGGWWSRLRGPKKRGDRED